MDTASGQVTPLPTIASQTRSGFGGAVWRPGTSTLAVSLGDQVWQLDVRHDSATHLLDGVYVAGWAPDSGPLIATTGYQLQVGNGPYLIGAVTTSGQSASLIPLTHDAMTFPFLGFIKGS